MNEKNSAVNETTISRLFDAPIGLVWEVWTQPRHVAQWWGRRA